MTYTLKNMLEDVVVLPYDDTTLTTLDEAIHSYGDSSDTFIVMDEMTECFLTGKYISSFAEHINASLDSNKTITKLPLYILQRMALYKAYIIVNESEDELTQAVLASIFMNYLILFKSDFNSLPMPDVILSFYKYHISSYLAKTDNVKVCGQQSLIEEIAHHGFSASSIDSSKLDELKMMAKESFLYRSEKKFNEQNIRSIDDPFVKVYTALKAYIQASDHLYYNIPYQMILEWIFDEEPLKRTARKKLSTIIDTVKPNGSHIKECYTSSSILLRLILGEKIKRSEVLMNKQFSLEEFTVYLYYELLIERIIAKITE